MSYSRVSNSKTRKKGSKPKEHTIKRESYRGKTREEKLELRYRDKPYADGSGWSNTIIGDFKEFHDFGVRNILNVIDTVAIKFAEDEIEIAKEELEDKKTLLYNAKKMKRLAKFVVSLDDKANWSLKLERLSKDGFIIKVDYWNFNRKLSPSEITKAKAHLKRLLIEKGVISITKSSDKQEHIIFNLNQNAILR